MAIKQYFPNDQKIGREVVDGLHGFKDFIASLKTDFYKVSELIIDHGSSGKVLLIKIKRVGH